MKATVREPLSGYAHIEITVGMFRQSWLAIAAALEGNADTEALAFCSIIKQAAAVHEPLERVVVSRLDEKETPTIHTHLGTTSAAFDPAVRGAIDDHTDLGERGPDV